MYCGKIARMTKKMMMASETIALLLRERRFQASRQGLTVRALRLERRFSCLSVYSVCIFAITERLP